MRGGGPRARKAPRSVLGKSCGKTRGKNARWVKSHGATGPGCVRYSFLIANGGKGSATVHKKRSVRTSAPKFAKRKRELSPVPSELRRSSSPGLRVAEVVVKLPRWFLFSMLTCSSVYASENDRRGLGWERGAVEPEGVQGAVSAGAVPSGGFGGGRFGLSARAVAAGARAVVPSSWISGVVGRPVLVIRLLRSKLTRWLRWGERRRMQPRWRLGRRQGSRVAPRQGGRRWGDVPASGGHRSLSREPRGRRRTGRSALRRPLAWPGGCRCASGPACGAPVASSVAVAHLGTGGVFPPGGRVEWLL